MSEPEEPNLILKFAEAQRDAGMMEGIAEAQRIVNDYNTRRMELGALYGPVGPGSRRLRFKHAVQRRGSSWRGRLASWIEP